jgi:hypothetical protein
MPELERRPLNHMPSYLSPLGCSRVPAPLMLPRSQWPSYVEPSANVRFASPWGRPSANCPVMTSPLSHVSWPCPCGRPSSSLPLYSPAISLYLRRVTSGSREERKVRLTCRRAPAVS